MIRRVAVPLALLVAVAPAAASAEASVDVDASGAAEYSSNVYSAPDGIDPIADQILSVRPKLEAQLETRGLSLSAAYRLDYYHYTNETDLSRALHRLDARAALVWWDDVDLELVGRLEPRAVSFSAPIDDPTNQVQQAGAGGRFAYRREFGPSTRGSVGYRGEQVTWLELHEQDDGRLPPEYFTHGPELSVERDVGRRLVVGLDYGYRFQDYDESSDVYPPTGDYAAHQAQVRAGLDATDWLSLSAAVGMAQVEFAEADPESRQLADLRVTAGGDVARLSANYRQHLTQDVFGNPIDTRAARLVGEYTPYAPWGVGLAASYGELAFQESRLGLPASAQAFVLGEARVFYQVSAGIVELAASHHESLPEGGDPKIVVDRASLRLGGRF